MSETPQQKIGRYEIEREIGRGGMAIVYKAHDPRLERPVAIKLIKMSAFGEDAFGHVRERFEREAKALARLDHPNILKVHDFGEHEGAPYLVMDYIEGSTLKELKKPVRVDTAVKLLTPIADALEYVHSQGLLHRDVKPSNIMITQNGRVILTDFGIVKSLEEDSELHTLTATGVGIGTPEYMSPEQGRGMTVDARSDMYSLSIVFYELITGRKPFTGDTPVNVLLKQISEPLPDPRQFVPEISVSVKKFLDRAAAKDPADRYPTTKEYLLDLEGLKLQAQANRAAGGASNSGFQSLPRKTEATASSIEIACGDLAKVRAEAGETDAPTIGALIKRTFLFLEDGDWKKADEYCERVLDRDPENGTAYLAKLMGKFKVRRIEDLEALSEPLDGDGLYEKAIRFGDEALRSRLEGANRSIRERKAEKVYQEGLGFIERKAYADAERVFGTIPDYKDAGKLAEEARSAKLREEERKRESAKWARDAAKKKRKRVWAWVGAAAFLILGFILYQRWRGEREYQEQMRAIRARQTQTAEAFSMMGTAEAEATRTSQAQTATEIAKYKVGDVIKFGRYEQDNNTSNGAEEIEWRVLDIEGDTALIVSVMGLDAKPYNEEYKAITWENCTLWAWLNDEFYNAAFSEEERERIALTHVVNEDNPKYSTDGGNDTEDHVYLLSIAEAMEYFRDSDDRVAKPTDYAIANGAFAWKENGGGWWWLRSPVYSRTTASAVNTFGGVYYIGGDVNDADIAVRPAMRIKLGN